jgi:hypothetical protein
MILKERINNMIQILITIKDKETLENYKDICNELIIEDFINSPISWFDVMDEIKVYKTNIDAEKYIIEFIEKITAQYPELKIDYEYNEEEDYYRVRHTNKYLQFGNTTEFLNHSGNLLRTILYDNNIYNFSFGYDYDKDQAK